MNGKGRCKFFESFKGISFETGSPMIFKRKDAKAHGTKKLVEGIYSDNDRCLVVDDVVTSGISILETVEVAFLNY